MSFACDPTVSMRKNVNAFRIRATRRDIIPLTTQRLRGQYSDAEEPIDESLFLGLIDFY
jgi:hypothetical protein